MKTKLRLILAIGVLSAASQIFADNSVSGMPQEGKSKNLMTNPGFELPYWLWKVSKYWGGKATLVKDADLAHSGKGSMKLVATKAKGTHWGRIFKKVKVENFTSRRFRYSVWVKGKGELLLGVIKCSHREGRKGFDANYFWKESTEMLTGEWQKVTYEFTITNPEVFMIRTALEVRGEGSEVYLDDVNVSTITNSEVIVEANHEGHLAIQDGESVDLSYKISKAGKAHSDAAVTLLITEPSGRNKTVSGTTDSAGHYAYSMKNLKFDSKGIWRIICSDVKTSAFSEVVINVMEKESYEKMSSIAKKVKIKKPIHILYLGDSLTDYERGHNYTDKIKFWINKYNSEQTTFLNAGVGGDYITRVWKRILGIDGQKPAYRQSMYSDLFDKKTDMVFIFLGHNDTKADSAYDYKRSLVSPKTQEKTYRQLIEYIRSKSDAEIVFISSTSSVIPLCVAYAEKRAAMGKRHEMFGRPEKLEAFNDTVKKLADEFKFDYIDVYNPTKNHPDKARLFNPKDGIHLTEKGNDFIAEILLKYFSEKR